MILRILGAISLGTAMLLIIGCSKNVKSYENGLYHIDVIHHSGGTFAHDDVMLTGHKISPVAPRERFRLFAVLDERTANVEFISKSVIAVYTRWVDEWQRPYCIYIANAGVPPDQIPVVDELTDGTDSVYATQIKGHRYFVTIGDSLDVRDVTAVIAWRYDKDYYGDFIRQAGYLLVNATHVDAEFVSDTVLALYVDWPGASYDTIYANVGQLPDSSMGLSMSREKP